MVKKVDFIEAIHDDPADLQLIAECMTFRDVQGHQQLLCILKGESSSFKISCDDQGSCEIVKRKLRFIGTNFFTQVAAISQDEQQSKLHQLCSLLQHEITEGRALLEQKSLDGKRQVIASSQVALRLQNGGLIVKNKKNRAVHYAKITTAEQSFFQTVANAFGLHIQRVLQFHEQYVKNSQPIEPTSPEGVRRAEEHKIVAKTLTTSSIWDFFASMKDAFFKLFDFKSEERKIQEKHLIFERNLLAEKREIDAERQARAKDNERFESRRQERKLDERRYEVSLEERKLTQRKQDLRIFGK